MAEIVSAADKTKLRADAHSQKIYGSVFIPKTSWTARINDAGISRGDTSIAFDGGSGTQTLWLKIDTEVWVGTSAGEKDVGRLRLKNFSSGDGGVTGTITVAQHPLILQDDHFLTFKFDFPLRQKFPFIDGNGTFFKDGNEAYSNQNQQPLPVIVAGPDRAKFLSGASVVFNIDLSGSYAIAQGATITSYSVGTWPGAGVTVNVNSGTGIGDITFTVPGDYWIEFSCTDSNGKTRNTFRWYHVASTDPNDPTFPLIDFSSINITGDWQRGGYSSGFSVYDNATVSEIPDQARIIIWQVAYYQGAEDYITLLPDESNNLLAGYLVRENVQADKERGLGVVDFEIHTIQEILRRFNFNVSLEVVQGTPDKWWKYEEWLTAGRAVHHLLEEHSTLFKTADVIGLLDNTIPTPYVQFEKANLYEMADSFLYRKSIRHRLVSDQASRLHMTPDIQLLTDTERDALDTAFVMTIDDVSGELRFRRETTKRVAFVKVAGFWWDGSTFIQNEAGQTITDSNPVCSSAPGAIPADEGEGEVFWDRHHFTSQTHCDQIAGRVFAAENVEYATFPISFPGNYFGVLDFAYPYWYEMSLQAGDTPRGVIWTNRRFILRSVTVRLNTETGISSVEADFEGEQEADPGVAGFCLDTIPDYGGEDDIDYGTIDFPDALATGGADDIWFKPGNVNDWQQRSATKNVLDLVQDPFWPDRQGTFGSDSSILWKCGLGFIERSVDGGQNWVDVTPVGPIGGVATSNITFAMISENWFFQSEFAVIGRYFDGADWTSWIFYTDDDGATWSWVETV